MSINTNKAPKPVGSYPHAKRAGDLLFLSGIGPRSTEGDHSAVPGLETDKNGKFINFNFETFGISFSKIVTALGPCKAIKDRSEFK